MTTIRRAPTGAGTWWPTVPVGRSISLECPKCSVRASVGKEHVLDDGRLDEPYRCINVRCDFYDGVTLDGWTPASPKE